MAIGKYSAVPPPPEPSAHHPPPAPTPTAPQNIPSHSHSASGTIDIEAWTIQALQSLSVSPDSRGTGGQPLAIPLDDHGRARGVTIALNDEQAAEAGIGPARRMPLRRDSLKRREALLKGKEGSRQRRRWDMARLTDVPHVEPPQPSDWEPRPVYPIHHIPYHIAQYWDHGLREQVEAKSNVARKRKTSGEGKGRVPRDLRETIKKTPGVKGWVRTLEGPVRQFLIEQGEAQEPKDESDFSDEEIVFVGRKVAPRDGWKKAHREVHDHTVDRGMIYDSLEDDESSAFKRFLTHSISSYYGLESRSVNMGTPSRRCVYIGIRAVDLKKGSQIYTDLPRPLWELF
ncbi:hypothetical protein N0V93_007536 [Gnomoniopsis smithogilvyi]|uniref:R3H-associated N-terminal domain-containing protein n=1 Tax=Gnomoniopsis smithogilvyi TaxID=1191159 RepID=A0A9W9CVG3_9PEZI|nr:hypothetical protein N0V93_007536 [Gnomoniopsis smithogilvyi]